MISKYQAVQDGYVNNHTVDGILIYIHLLESVKEIKRNLGKD